MKKLLLLPFLFWGVSSLGQFSHFVNSNSSAERVSTYGVNGTPNDRFEITNATQFAGSFIPALWAHQQSDNRFTMSLFATTSSGNDVGDDAIMLFRTELRNNINLAAPSGPSIFPWGATGSNVVTRPLFAWQNGDNILMQMLANGNLGLGTDTPSARLHNWVA